MPQNRKKAFCRCLSSPYTELVFNELAYYIIITSILLDVPSVPSLRHMSFSYHLYGHTAHDAIIEDIRSAKYSIKMEMFIISVDDTGLRLLDVLRERAREGVKVRLLADAVGSFYLYRDTPLQDQIKKDGVHLSFFNHLIPWQPKNLPLWYFRNHRRTIVIDDKICSTGSVCFADHMRDWRETMVRADDADIAKDMTNKFERMWKLSEHGIFSKREKSPRNEAVYITNSPVPGRRLLYRKFIELVKASKEEILITTPYFIPDHRLFRALEKARRRNVSIKVLMPRVSNHRYVDWAGDYDKTLLMQKGVEFYFHEGMVHSKTAVFDRNITCVGSMNLDNISLRYNFESGLVISDEHAAGTLASHFTEDLNKATLLTLEEWEKRPMLQKFLMNLMWPFRKLL